MAPKQHTREIAQNVTARMEVLRHGARIAKARFMKSLVNEVTERRSAAQDDSPTPDGGLESAH